MNEEIGSVEIVRADPAFRKKAVILLIGFALVAWLLIDWVKNLLEEIQKGATNNADQAIAQIKEIVIWMAAGNALISILVVAFLIRIGVRVLSQERFPPRSMKVLKDTPIRRGTKARITGIVFFVIALLVLSTNAVWIVMFLWMDSLVAST